MSPATLPDAHRLLTEAVAALTDNAGPSADDDALLSVLTVAEGVARMLDKLTVDTIAALERRCTFSVRGYRSAAAALADLVGWERFEARRRIVVAEQVCAQINLDGSVRPARLDATAAAFTRGAASLRHVEVITRVLGSDAARRLTPDQWAEVEKQLAAQVGEHTPAQLLDWGTRLVELLDQDGPEPDDTPPPLVNELHLRRRPDRPGGTIIGRFDDAALFDAIATAIDAHARPRCAEDGERPAAARQAEALADICGFVLDHGDLPHTAGQRPHMHVTVRLEDLENRARAACLAFGGTLSPQSLRMLCCDAAVIPVVLGSTSQPLDIGRLSRVIPDGIRRAVTVRDGGCARCGKPPSWCEIHHIQEWENGGPTDIHNCVLLCRSCHRLIHHAGWTVTLAGGIPEFYPPPWIDPQQRPRRRPPNLLAG